MLNGMKSEGHWTWNRRWVSRPGKVENAEGKKKQTNSENSMRDSNSYQWMERDSLNIPKSDTSANTSASCTLVSCLCCLFMEMEWGCAKEKK